MNLHVERDTMTEPAARPKRALESFRSYLRLLAAAQVPWQLRGAIDPSDMVQDTMLKAHERFAQFKGDCDAELAAWLRRMLKNTILDALRREDARPEFVGSVEGSSNYLEGQLADNQSSPSERAYRQEQLERLAQALELLPEEQRLAVQLQQIHDHSVQEIAEAMDLSKSAVGGLLKRGMRRLRELMREESDHERT
jgi:RNA polymerase sigma-70 factor (ECF subfamily)